MSNLHKAIKALLGVASTYLLFKFNQKDLAPKSPNETILKKLTKVIGENKVHMTILAVIAIGGCIYYLVSNDGPTKIQIGTTSNSNFENPYLAQTAVIQITTITSKEASQLRQRYRCYISEKLLNDPVRLVCHCDQNYERSQLLQYIQKNGDCPSCHQKKSTADIQQNSLLKLSIEHFRKRVLKKARRRIQEDGLNNQLRELTI